MAASGAEAGRSRPAAARALVLALLPLLALQLGCSRLPGSGGDSDGPGRVVSPDEIEDMEPRREPYSKYGNPDSYVVNGKRYYTLKSSKGFTERGIASWYGSKFHGRRTSSGEPYDMYRMTAAHKQLPLPTYVQVRNLDNGRTATVKVNDRGPFHDNRVIDLSYAAALKLGLATQGTAFVEVRALDASGQPSGPPLARTETQVSTPPSAGPRPPAKAPAPAISAMFIQVGAFQDRGNAERMSAEIGRAVPGDGVHIKEIDSNGRRYYRVQIGPITDTERADKVLARLDAIGVRQHTFITQ